MYVVIQTSSGLSKFILSLHLIYVPLGGKNKPSFEQTAETGMLSNAGEEEEVVKTVLPVKAATQEVAVETEDETEREDDTKVPLWRAIFRKLRFSECLILI